MTAQECAELPTETRLALQEQQMRLLLGNGQPGMVHELKEEIKKLNEKMTRIIAVVAILAGGSGIGLGALFGG